MSWHLSAKLVADLLMRSMGFATRFLNQRDIITDKIAPAIRATNILILM